MQAEAKKFPTITETIARIETAIDRELIGRACGRKPTYVAEHIDHDEVDYLHATWYTAYKPIKTKIPMSADYQLQFTKREVLVVLLTK